MDEQQMMNDILDSMYGYDILLKEGDADTIVLKKKEREEKYNEILFQINSICTRIEKELKEILGNSGAEIKKYIRSNVLKSIKAEIDNGNKVIDSNGKINTGKIFDIVNQSKDEILEKIENEKDVEAFAYQDDDNRNESQTDDAFEKLFEHLSDAGLDLSEEERQELQEIMNEVNKILSELQQSIDSGMTLEEAWDKKRKEVGDEEFKKIKEKFKLVGKTVYLANKKDINNPEQEHESKPTDMDEPSGTPSSDESAGGSTEKKAITYINNKIKIGNDALFAASYLCFEEQYNRNSIIDFPDETKYDIKDSYFWKKSGTGLVEKVEGLVSDEEAKALMQAILMQEKHPPNIDITDEQQPQILNPGSPKQDIIQSFMEDSNTYNSSYQDVSRYGVIKDFQMADFLMRNGDELIADLFDLSRTEVPTLENVTHESTHATIGVEEVDVDEAVVTQGESLEETDVTNGTMSENALLSFLEDEGTVREISEANAMVQRLMFPEKSPEISTKGKTDTQSAPVAENEDKGEDGPGEL